MNKKVLIDKWESKTGAPSYVISDLPINLSKIEMYIAGYGVARKEILEDLKQLDEPQKPVVPKFVADWISFCKNKNKDLSYAMHDNFLRNFLLERFGDNDNRVRWLTDYKNQEIFARAWLDGYEVEKEQLYRVVINNRYLAKMSNFSDVVILVSEDEISECATESYELTEKQIKAIDERYWPFAVPVEEEEG